MKTSTQNTSNKLCKIGLILHIAAMTINIIVFATSLPLIKTTFAISPHPFMMLFAVISTLILFTGFTTGLLKGCISDKRKIAIPIIAIIITLSSLFFLI
jgi:hypothetical protein